MQGPFFRLDNFRTVNTEQVQISDFSSYCRAEDFRMNEKNLQNIYWTFQIEEYVLKRKLQIGSIVQVVADICLPT